MFSFLLTETFKNGLFSIRQTTKQLISMLHFSFVRWCLDYYLIELYYDFHTSAFWEHNLLSTNFLPLLFWGFIEFWESFLTVRSMCLIISMETMKPVQIYGTFVPVPSSFLNHCLSSQVIASTQLGVNWLLPKMEVVRVHSALFPTDNLIYNCQSQYHFYVICWISKFLVLSYVNLKSLSIYTVLFCATNLLYLSEEFETAHLRFLFACIGVSSFDEVPLALVCRTNFVQVWRTFLHRCGCVSWTKPIKQKALAYRCCSYCC